MSQYESYGSLEETNRKRSTSEDEDDKDGGSVFKEELIEIPIEEALDNAGFTGRHLIVFVIMSLAVLADHMELEVGVLLGPKLLCEWNLEAEEEAMLTSIMYLGMTIGAILWGNMSDRYGRKPVIQTIVLLGGISAVLSSISWNPEMFAVFRFFVGLFVGGFHVCYTLVTECVGSKLRARACFFLFVAHYMGTLVGSALAFLTMSEGGFGGWRAYILIASSPLLLIFIMVTLLCPESPRFLMVSGKPNEALEVIKHLNPSSNKNTILSKIQVESRGSMSDLFKSFTNARIIITLAISFAILRFENLGITLMYFEYLQNPKADECHLFIQTYNIEKKCEPLKSDDYLLNIAYTNSHLGAAILSTVMADVFGRRFALIFATFFGTCAFTSYYFCMPSYLITLFAILTKCLALSCVMVMFLFINELFPTYIRSVASGFVDSCSRTGLILSPFIAQFLSKEDYKIALSCYIATGFIAVILFQSIKEETKDQAQVDSDKIEENLKGH